MKHSRFLFVLPSGEPMTFFMKPSDEKSKVRPLIEHGGGVMLKNAGPNTIRLVADEEKVIAFAGCAVPSRYIWDCVAKNCCLEVSKYQLDSEPRSDSASDLSYDSFEGDARPISAISRHSRSHNEFMACDDQAILNFIIKSRRYSEVNGNVLWKDMESQKVASNHPWQSLRNHYLKYILPKIDCYGLSAEEKKFIRDFSNGRDTNDSDDSDCSVSPKKTAKAAKKRRNYNKQEDKNILKYIVDNHLHSDVKGNALWKAMKREQVTTHPWQSMRNRFLKVIAPKINRYGFSDEKLRPFIGVIRLPSTVIQCIEIKAKSRAKLPLAKTVTNTVTEPHLDKMQNTSCVEPEAVDSQSKADVYKRKCNINERKQSELELKLCGLHEREISDAEDQSVDSCDENILRRFQTNHLLSLEETNQIKDSKGPQNLSELMDTIHRIVEASSSDGSIPSDDESSFHTAANHITSDSDSCE